MLNIDFLTIKAFFIENYEFLKDARIQKIQQPTRRDFIFTLRNHGRGEKLYVNINPQFYHIAFMSKKNEEKRNIEIPQKPPMFCMLLRKYLEECKISDVKVIKNERILEFFFETTDEFTCKRSLCLCIELMGKHSNVILYDRESFLIIGCAHNIGSEKSRWRELQGGLKYIYPPANTNILSNELKYQFADLSEQAIQEYLTTSDFRPAITQEKYTLFQELLENSIPTHSVNDMIDCYYADFQQKITLNCEKNKLREIANAKLRKINNSADKISQLRTKRNNIDKYKLYGELLTANLYQQCDYQKSIEVLDYYTNNNITIELDETKTLSENAQRYYKLYNKAKTTQEKTIKMLEELNLEREYTEHILYAIETAEKIADLEEIKIELGVKNIKHKKLEKAELTKVNIDGFDIYVGKNNKQNDFIISKLAKDDDIWFHTKLCAGSHVLLKIQENEPNENILYECCKLARKYSSATQPSKVAVIYTKAKYLRKPPASPLGYVTYKNEKEVLV